MNHIVNPVPGGRALSHYKPGLILLLMFIILSASVSLVEANGASVTVSPNPLIINHIKDQGTFSGTFYVSVEKEVGPINLYVEDLYYKGASTTVDDIKATDITLSKSTIEGLKPGGSQQITLTINNATQPGTWEGNLVLQWVLDNSPDMIKVPLEVTNRTKPALSLVQPTKVLFKAYNSGWITPVTQEAIISETTQGANVDKIKFIPQSLTSDDQSKSLLGENITAKLKSSGVPGTETTTLPAGERGRVSVTIDTKGVPSGKFEGNLIVMSENAADLSIPLEVSVKDGPFLPAIVLFAGIVIGSLLTYYRNRLQKGDLVMKKALDLQELYSDDKFFIEYFGNKVDNLQRSIDNFLLQKEADEAEKCFVEIRQLWADWDHNRDVLVKAIEDIKDLIATINENKELLKRPAIQHLLQEMQDTLENHVPEYVKTPDGLTKKLEDIVAGTGWRPVYLAAGKLQADIVVATIYLEEKRDYLDLEDYTQFIQENKQIDQAFDAIDKVPTVIELREIQTQIVGLKKKIESSLEQAVQDKDAFTSDNALASHFLSQAESLKGGIQDTGHFIDLFDQVKAGRDKSQQDFNERRWKHASWKAARTRLAAWALICNCQSAKARQGKIDGAWRDVYQAEEALSNAATVILNSNKQVEDSEQNNIEKLVNDLETHLRNTIPDHRFNLPGKSVAEPAKVRPAEVHVTMKLASEDEIEKGIIHKTREDHTNDRYRRYARARRRVQNVALGTAILALGLAAIVGYADLYQNNPTFGSVGVMSYVALFVWGFGSEATSVKIASLISQLAPDFKLPLDQTGGM